MAGLLRTAAVVAAAFAASLAVAQVEPPVFLQQHVICDAGCTLGSATTPAAFSGTYAIATGGSAQNLAAAAEIVNGCIIKNPQSATEQGIAAAESLRVNFVTTATQTAGGTTIELEPGVAIPCPGKTTLAISINAATTGHKLEGYRF